MASSTERTLPWVYDALLWMFDVSLSIFFREIYAPGAWRIPRQGPVIIVGAPHANQFVDSAMLMRILKRYAGRRICQLIAEKSFKQFFIGNMAACAGALPVVRAQDNVKPGPGRIFLPDVLDDAFLIRGNGTDFTDSRLFMVGGSIILPKIDNKPPEQRTIAEILGPDRLRLKSPFEDIQAEDPRIDQGTPYKVAPYVNQDKMFDAVYQSLEAGSCVGIFPEGGSHDRPSLLPLKPGVAIMALGTLVRSPNCGLTIIPCGMNYFSPNKFRSRAVLEFGPPVQVSSEQIEAFKLGGASKRNAIGSLLETIQEALNAVTQQAPDRETLMLIQATRRLYKPLRMKLPLPVVVELNRRLLKGYTQFKDQPQAVRLKQAVLKYDRQLKALGIRDHQVEWGNARRRPWSLVLLTLLYRIGELLVLTAGTLPSLILFWPVFVTTRHISHKRQREALAHSVVKMDGRDVVGSWKIIVAMGFAPALYIWYTLVTTTWLYYNRQEGYYTYALPYWMRATTYIPNTVPLSIFAIAFFFLMVATSLAGLRFGEIGVDILRSLPPLFLALNPNSSATLVKLRAQRKAVVAQVVKTMDIFGPEVFEFYEHEKLVNDEGGASDEDVELDYATYKSRLKSMPSSGTNSPMRRRSSFPDSPVMSNGLKMSKIDIGKEIEERIPQKRTLAGKYSYKDEAE